MIARRRIRCGLLGVLLLLTHCGQPTTEPALSYAVGECDQSIAADELANWPAVEITAQGGTVRVRQQINYVCCAEIRVEMQQEGGVVKLIETNVGEICRCMCGYTAEMEITGLPAGRYTIQVWGIQYEDVHPLELLGEATVDL